MIHQVSGPIPKIASNSHAQLLRMSWWAGNRLALPIQQALVTASTMDHSFRLFQIMLNSLHMPRTVTKTKSWTHGSVTIQILVSCCSRVMTLILKIEMWLRFMLGNKVHQWTIRSTVWWITCGTASILDRFISLDSHLSFRVRKVLPTTLCTLEPHQSLKDSCSTPKTQTTVSWSESPTHLLSQDKSWLVERSYHIPHGMKISTTMLQ